MHYTDLNRGPFREEAERTMASLLQQTKFRKCNEYLQGSIGNCADRFGRLKLAAVSLCEIPGVQLQGVSIAGRGKRTYNYLYTMHTISTKVVYVSPCISITMHTHAEPLTVEDNIDDIMQQANKNLEDLDIPSVYSETIIVIIIVISNTSCMNFVLLSEVRYGLREKIKLLIDR